MPGGHLPSLIACLFINPLDYRGCTLSCISSVQVLKRLQELFVKRGVPECIHSDNGAEFAAIQVREWLSRLGVKTL